MTEVFFYHMTESRLEQALPDLLERSIERGWKVVVQSSTEKQRDELNKHLWVYRDASFLPHSANEEAGDEQPIWLTTTNENQNSADIRFMIHGSSHDDLDAYTRAVYMFDGHDIDAVNHARERWKIEKAVGHDLTYWQQGDGGRWKKKA